jgi:predicted metal-dependent hydrolase
LLQFIYRLSAISKLGWIKQQQKKLQEQQREPPREYLDRESHYVWGMRYLLQVMESDTAPAVELKHSKNASAGSARHRRGQEAGHRG